MVEARNGGIGRQLDQYAILAELAADPAHWQGVGGYPSTVICRYLLVLADWAAEQPSAWRVSRLHFEQPERALPVLAEMLSLAEPEVRRFMRPQVLIEDGIVTAGNDPAVPRPPGSLTYCRAVHLIHSVCCRPVQWRAWRLCFDGLTQCQTAAVLQISQQRISQLLRRPMLLPEIPAEWWHSQRD